MSTTVIACPDSLFAQPTYRRVADDLRRDIVEGRLAIGSRLPGEIALSRRLGISRFTLREALRLLRDEGALEPRKGSGWRVTEPKTERPPRIVLFADPDEGSTAAILVGMRESAGTALDIDVRVWRRGEDPVLDQQGGDPAQALVVLRSDVDPAFRSAVVRTGRPILWLNHSGHEAFDTIAADHRHGAGLLVDEAVARGHRRIVYIGKRNLHHRVSTYADRLDGYRRAMERHELTSHAVLHDQCLLRTPELNDHLASWFSAASDALDGPPTCVIAGAQWRTFAGFMNRGTGPWAGCGICGFGDGSVNPFDDLPFDRCDAIPEPWTAIGRTAGARLRDLLAGHQAEPRLTLVPMRLAAGHSIPRISPSFEVRCSELSIPNGSAALLIASS